jgi:hypothetical protein
MAEDRSPKGKVEEIEEKMAEGVEGRRSRWKKS